MNDTRPTHLDLFSGIGGFSLAFEREGFRTIGFAEIDPYASAVLRKHWPNVHNYGDVRNVGRLYRPINIITGGFPCQEISIAGNGKGLEGKRSGMWFWMLEIIKRNQPDFCLIENSPMLRTRGGDKVLLGLERAGYAARPYVVEAAAAGADQERPRAWIVAYLVRNRKQRQFRGGGDVRQDGQGWQSVAAHLQGTDWRTRPLFGGGASPILCRRTDGIPARMDRIRCLGNSIVPQVAQIFARFIYQQLTQ